jgi:hypothetical protein
MFTASLISNKLLATLGLSRYLEGRRRRVWLALAAGLVDLMIFSFIAPWVMGVIFLPWAVYACVNMLTSPAMFVFNLQYTLISTL